MKGIRILLFGNIVGKIVGILREILLAALFGTGPAVAAFRVAQTATLTPINFFTADALSAGFLPEHSLRLKENRQQAESYYALVSRILVLVSGALLVILLAFREHWVRLIAPGLDATISSQAAAMLGVMALGVPFYISTNLGSYLEMSHGSFRLAAMRPTVQSIGLIAGTALAFLLSSPLFLAIGFSGAYVALAVYSFYRLRSLQLTNSTLPTLATLRLDSKVFWCRIRPMLMAPIFLQGSWIVERAVASLIGVDSVAAIDYSRMITDTVVVTIAAPLGLNLLVELSTKTPAAANRQLTSVMSVFLALFVPASTLLMVASHPLVTVIFQRGQFGASSSEVTSTILTGLAVGMFAQGLALILIKGLNARRQNGRAAISIIAGCLAMIVFELCAYKGLGPATIGLGASLAGLIQIVFAATALGVFISLARFLIYAFPHFLFASGALFYEQSQHFAVQANFIACVCTLCASLLWTFCTPQLRTPAIKAMQALMSRPSNVLPETVSVPVSDLSTQSGGKSIPSYTAAKAQEPLADGKG